MLSRTLNDDLEADAVDPIYYISVHDDLRNKIREKHERNRADREAARIDRAQNVRVRELERVRQEEQLLAVTGKARQEEQLSAVMGIVRNLS